MGYLLFCRSRPRSSPSLKDLYCDSDSGVIYGGGQKARKGEQSVFEQLDLDLARFRLILIWILSYMAQVIRCRSASKFI